MSKINLLQLVTGLNIGGAEKVVYDLSCKLDNNKYNIIVGSLLEDGEMVSLFNASKINLFKGKLRIKSLRGSIETLKTILQNIKEYNIDIIHAHMFHALVYASIIKIFKPRVSIVFTLHTTKINTKVREWILYFLKPLRMHDILFTSLEPVRFYCKNPVIIPNGINVDQYEYSDEVKQNRFTFICVGGYRPAKNYLNFIEVLGKANLKIDYQLLIAGSGELESRIKSVIKENKLENNIVLLGLRDDIPSLLKKCHVFLMPSLWEGLPIALLEAGAAGMPVIATAVGNIPKILNSSTGYLSPWEEFPRKMKEIFYNYDEAKKKGENLRNLINEKYSLDSTINKHDQLYSKVL